MNVLHLNPKWSSSRSRAPWITVDVVGPIALVAVAAILLFFDIGSRVLVTNDEARFPLLARHMLEGGSWMLPQIDHIPYSNKPPLCAWLIALAAWPAGTVTQVSALVPSLIAGFGVVLATAWIGWRVGGRSTALIAGFIVVTTHGVFTLARTPTPDMILCWFLTAAMAAFVASRFGEHRVPMAACYAFIGLAFWAKGPAGLLGLAILVVAAGWAEGWRGLRRLGLPWGVPMVAALIAPWWIVSAHTGGDHFWSTTVATDWLAWYLPSGRGGWRALGDPIGQTLAILLPWSVLVPFALGWLLRRPGESKSRDMRFLLAWLAIVFVIIGVSEQQRMRYYLPLCPPAAILLASWLQHFRIRRARLLALTTAAAVVAGLLVWQLADTTRRNQQTDLAALRAPILARPAPLFAVNLPELVLTFYLDRTVHALSTRDSATIQIATPGYLAVADRTLPPWVTRCAVRPVGAGLVNGRPFSFFRLETSGCGTPSAHLTSGPPGSYSETARGSSLRRLTHEPPSPLAAVLHMTLMARTDVN